MNAATKPKSKGVGINDRAGLRTAKASQEQDPIIQRMNQLMLQNKSKEQPGSPAPEYLARLQETY